MYKDYETLGQKLKRERMRCGYTLNTVAALLNTKNPAFELTKSHISFYENDKRIPSQEVLDCLSEIYEFDYVEPEGVVQASYNSLMSLMDLANKLGLKEYLKEEFLDTGMCLFLNIDLRKKKGTDGLTRLRDFNLQTQNLAKTEVLEDRLKEALNLWKLKATERYIS